MKAIKLLFCLLVTANFIACSDNDSDPRIKGITLSGCKDGSANSRAEVKTSMNYEVKEGILIISLYDYYVTCDVTQMGADLSIEDDRIVLTPKMLDGGLVNCVCPMDFTFPITGLTVGKTYQCVINAGFLPYSFEFTFKEGVKGSAADTQRRFETQNHKEISLLRLGF